MLSHSQFVTHGHSHSNTSVDHVLARISGVGGGRIERVSVWVAARESRAGTRSREAARASVRACLASARETRTR